MKDYIISELKKEIANDFIEYSSIPHPSGNTQKMVAFLKQYAVERGFEAEENNSNLIIKIPATEGRNEESPVIIQAHMDMVAAKEEDSNHDFNTDPIRIVFDDNKDYLRADKTTLGADDGIGIVYMMMLMNDSEISHPKLYLVITSDEEIGLLGAKSLEVDSIKDAKYMINLDTEAEGYLSIGSSGGEAYNASYTLERTEALGNIWELTVSNTSGGHAGGDIDKNGAHAARALSQILGHLFHVNHIRLVEYNAKGVDNVITTSATATFLTDAPQKVIADNTIFIAKDIATAYHDTDPDLKIDLKQRPRPDKLLAYTLRSTARVIFCTLFAPYGVMTKSNGRVTTSCNIGNCYTQNDLLSLRIHARFKADNFKELIKNKIIQYFTFGGAIFEALDCSPAWSKKEDSSLQELASEVWYELYNDHLLPVDGNGILECGVFQQKIPELDIISFGPTVKAIHTPNEELDLNSAARVYLFLVKLLERLN